MTFAATIRRWRCSASSSRSRSIPGRKTIVFFSEGLPVSPVLSTRLDWVIEAANRSNITAYVVDAHGLRAASTTTAMRKEMQDFVDERSVSSRRPPTTPTSR